jgi:aminopeptidase YwaD
VLLQTPPASVHLRIESERRTGGSCNVVGRRGAADRPKVVLCAHYDTKIGTPGATDNAAGTAVLLALAERLEHQELALEFVAFSGHEYLPLGDDEYVRLGEAQFPEIVAALNFDAVGNALGAGSIAAFRCAPRFQEAVAALTDAYPRITWVEPWPASNHSTFAWRGVPSLAFSSLLGGNITHQVIDTVDRVSLERLVEHVTLAEAIVERLHGKTPAWTREAGSDEDA